MSIASKIQRLLELGATLATTLRAKGVEASDTEGFESLVPKVAEIGGGYLTPNEDWFKAAIQTDQTNTYTFTPSIKEINDDSNALDGITIGRFALARNSMTRMYSNSIMSLNYSSLVHGTAEEINFPNATRGYSGLIYGSSTTNLNPKKIVLGFSDFRKEDFQYAYGVEWYETTANLTSMTSVTSATYFVNRDRLKMFKVGQGTDINILMQLWTASNVIAEGEASQLELISNARTGLLDRVASHTGEGLVRTITAAWVGTLSESEYESVTDALEELMTDFAEKGWTLQG